MKLYEINGFFPDGSVRDYGVRANNYVSAVKKLAKAFFEKEQWPSDWKATVKFQAYRVR